MSGKSDRKDAVDICYCSDERYLKYVLISIYSIKKNNAIPIRFHILIDYCSEKTQEEIKGMGAGFGADISFHKIDKNRFDSFFVRSSHLTIATYYRILIPEIFYKYKNVLYLDGDVLCTASIQELFSIDLQGKSIGAVSDVHKLLDHKHSLHLGFSHIYFNAGVILFDIARCKKKLSIKNAERVYLERKEVVKYEDQDILNMIFDEDVAYLPKNFNCIQLRDFNLSDCRLIHFANAPKPWSKYWRLNECAYGDFKEVYNAYLDEIYPSMKREDASIWDVMKWTVKKALYYIS